MGQRVSLVDRVPTPEEHRRLAEAVGWSHAFDWDTVAASLTGSRLGVVAVVDGEVVGMGRVVGDGALYFYVQDVAVLPAHQGTGLGRAILRRLLDQIADSAPASAFVGLFATSDGDALYRSEGFTTGDMQGMFRLVPPTHRPTT